MRASPSTRVHVPCEVPSVFLRVSVRLESNDELASIAVPDLPLANKVSATRILGEFGFSELNAINVGSKLLAVAVFVNNRGSLYIDARDLGHGEALPVTVFEDNHNWITIVRGRRVRLRKGEASEQDSRNHYPDENAHNFLRTKGANSF